MFIVDDVLTARAIAGRLPADLAESPLALCMSAHWRLLRAALSMQSSAQSPTAEHGGQIQKLLAPLTRQQRVRLHAPSPDMLHVLDPRLYSSVAASYANECGLNWFVADHVGAAAFHNAELVFSSERRVPPAVSTGSAADAVAYRVVA